MHNPQPEISGFTIVEVMIVLAIAGLILAVVFVAVPALQRNSRDTQRKVDVGNIRAGINTYASNNKGAIPDDVAKLTGAMSGIGLNFYSEGIIGLLTSADGDKLKVSVNKRTATVPAASGDKTPTVDHMHLIAGVRCGSSIPAPNTVYGTAGGGNAFEVGSIRQYVILYVLEADPTTVVCENN